MGGSESHFSVHPVQDNNRSRVVTLPSNQPDSSELVYERASSGHYQRLIIRGTKNGVNMRIVKEPRPYPYIVTRANDSRIFMSKGADGENGVWRLVIFGKKRRNRSYEKFAPANTAADFSLKWGDTENHALLIALQSAADNMWLASAHAGNPKMISEEEVMRSDAIAGQCLWVAECVDHGLTEGELAMAIAGPLAAVFAIPVAIIAAPIAIPAVAVAGAAAVAAVGSGTAAVVGGAIAHGVDQQYANGMRTGLESLHQAAREYLNERA